MEKKSVLISVLIVSILVVSMGLIILVQEVAKSYNEKNVAETEQVLLNVQQSNLGGLSGLSSLDNEIEDDDVFESLSLSSSGGGGGGSKKKPKKDDNSDVVGEEVDLVDTENEINFYNESENETNLSDVDFGIPNNETDLNLTESNQTEILVRGNCKAGSEETAEGPGGTYCRYNDYEECFDYKTKSTAIAYDCWLIPLGCGEVDRKTDRCSYSNSYILYEAWLDCGFTSLTADGVNWQTKNCNDYDKKYDWYYYCTSTEVRKKKYFYNYGCSNGACKVVWSGWVDDTLVSRKGYSDYCPKRKQYGCSLCGHGDYDCDWDSECYGSLYCTGSAWCYLGDCGCCWSGETWDKTRDECCECSSGVCCDGCHYKSSSSVCDYHYGSYYYSCPSGECVGDDVYRRDKRRYCSGSSSSCSGSIVSNSWQTYDYCGSTEFCNGDNTGWSYFYCSNAQCTSGVCCDTDCGDYVFKPSSVVCGNWYNSGCPWGTDLGDDVGRRLVNKHCSSSSSDCSGSLTYGSWGVSDYCNQNEYCDPDYSIYGCRSIDCSSDVDCSKDYWSGLVCSSNDVYGTFVDYSCKYPGTKQSECISQSTYGKKEECGSDSCGSWLNFCKNNDVWKKRTCYDKGCSNAVCFNNVNVEEEKVQECGVDEYSDNYCDGDSVYRDFIDRGCSSEVCFETTTKQKVEDCDHGCSYGECNPEDCENECGPLGQTRCDGDYVQTCGYYDTDLCFEWGGEEYCQSGCEDGECIIECSSDEECDDSNPYTEDICNNDGTIDSYCTHLTIACLKDADCGTDGWVEEPYCLSNNDLKQKFRTYECNYPGKSYSYCDSWTPHKLKESCPNKCVNGRCLVEVCTELCWWGRCETYCIWE